LCSQTKTVLNGSIASGQNVTFAVQISADFHKAIQSWTWSQNSNKNTLNNTTTELLEDSTFIRCVNAVVRYDDTRRLQADAHVSSLLLA